MEEEAFERKIETARQRLETLRQRAGIAPEQEALLAESLEDLSIALEELGVAGEELRQQNEGLAAARQALEAEHQRYQQLFEFAPDGYFVTDTIGSIQAHLLANVHDAVIATDEGFTLTAWNRAAEEMYGWPAAEVLGRSVREVIRPELTDTQLAEALRTLAETGRYRVEVIQHRRDGQPIVVEGITIALRGEDGRITGYVSVNHDITQRRQAEETLHHQRNELAEANERLKELDRLKSKFVSDVSHELRTPTANVILYLDLLERGKPDKYAQYLKTLKEQARLLVDLIEDILDLSRLEQEKERADFAPVDLNAVAKQIIDANRTRAEAAGLTLIFEPGAKLPPVPGKRDQLARVIANLTTNAINYTPAGQIKVSTHYAAEGDRLCLQVQDTGIGIAPEDIPHLFDRFYRSRRAGQLAIPGTGLGLAIVKEIVDLHGGTVEVESRNGEGSTFKVWLPLAKPDA